MNSESDFAAPFRLGDWLVQPDLNRVTGPSGEVRLEPRVMLVLVRLAAVPGEVVSRDTLLDEVWEGTFVGEESLTRAISDLRRVFGDDARRPTYVETIRHHGYRLIASVTEMEETETPPEVESTAAPAPLPPDPPRHLFGEAPKRRPFRPLGTLASLAVIAALFAGVKLMERQESTPLPAGMVLAPITSEPLTTYPGHERQPALSADGTRVAFAWTGPAGDAEGVWVKQRNSETPLRLSEGPGRAAWPVWSPDGQEVAWVQVLGDSSEVRSVPSLGGARRSLFATRGLVAGLDWTPDGRFLVMSVPDTGAGWHRLAALELANLEVTGAPYREGDWGRAAMTGSSDLIGSNVQPRVAPGGDRLAFIHLDEISGSNSVVVRDLLDGTSRTVLGGLAGLQGLAWSADGRQLVVASEHAGMYHLWTVPAVGGEARRLTAAGDFAWNPAVARNTGDLAYEQVRVDQDLWRIRIHGRDPWRLETGPFLVSTRWEYEADYSPDGARIAFVSARSGTPELWVCDHEGRDLRRLTTTGGDPVTRPRWSPDGTRVAYNVIVDGRPVVRLVSAEGGTPTELTGAGLAETVAGWSPAGGGLEVIRRAGGGWNLYRRGLDPEDDGGEIVRGRVVAAERSADGTLFFVGDARTIRRDEGDDPPALVSGLDPLDRHNWRWADNAIYWVLRTGGSAFLMVHDLTDGTDNFLTDLPGFAGTGLAVAPDGNEILYPRSGAAQGDLMLIPARNGLAPSSSGNL